MFCRPTLFGRLSEIDLDKVGLMSEWNQLFAGRNQLVAYLLVLGEKAAEVVELEAQFQQSEQEAMTHHQEATQLNYQL